MSPQKRTATESKSVLEGVRAILVDIEGTTTPISFVKETLFPYVTDNLDSFLEKHFDEVNCQADIEILRQLAKKDKEAEVDGVVEIPDDDADKDAVVKAVIANVKWQMSHDRKSKELKQLQGHIWKQAYKQGKIKGVLFPDVTPALRQMVADGIKIYVYSSGSIESQKLLFTYSQDGDICELFSGHFDTVTGSKCEVESYKKITKEIGVKAEEIIFLTDIPKEAAAAVSSGMRCNLVIREGNAELSKDDKMKYSTIHSFDELVDLGSKRIFIAGKEIAADEEVSSTAEK